MTSERAVTAMRTLAWVLVFVGPAAALASWFTPRPELDRDDAVETAVDSLAEAGVDADVEADDVVRSVHETPRGREVDVWIVPVEIDGEEIELRVQRTAGRLAYVDDRIGPDDAERLLTDEQFAVLRDYRNDAPTDGWARRNGAAAVAAMPIAGVAYVLAKRSAALWRAP